MYSHRGLSHPTPTRWPVLAHLLTACVSLAALIGTVPHARAQDLSKYSASQANIFVGTTTGNDSSDGNPATSTVTVPLYVAAPDANGNVYFIDGFSNTVKVVYAGGSVPPLLTFALNDYASFEGMPVVTPVAGAVYTIVNKINGTCNSGTTCGDGGPSVLGQIGFSYGLAFDAAGNLYIADAGSYSIREVSVQDGTLSTFAGDPNHAISADGGDGGSAASATFQSPYALAFDPSGNLYVTDTGADVVRRIDTTPNHIITTIAGQAGNVCVDAVSCGEGGPAASAALGGVIGIAIDTQGNIYLTEGNTNVVREIDHSSLNINTIAGSYTACADAVCGDGQPATQATLFYPVAVALNSTDNPIITDQGDNAIRGVLPNGTITTMAGQITQSQTAPPGTGNAGPAGSLQLNAPANAVLDSTGNLYISDVNNSLIWKVNAPVSLQAQTIIFNPIPAQTYGNASLDLTTYASSNSGLPLTFACTPSTACTGANDSTLQILGAGTVSIVASQAGNSTYSPATPVTSTVTVNPANLTVTADNISFPYRGAPQLPALTYTITGFVDGDSTSVVSGAPVLTTAATPSSPVGQYPITVGLGTLSAANYGFTPVNGVLTITGGATQTISFNALPGVTYGVATFSLGATASSGLPVTYQVSGPAKILGSNLTVTGVGTVIVTASQAGNSTYGAAPEVTQSFTVSPATLTVTAQPATRLFGQPNPAFTYAVTGFVNGDTQAVLSGAPAFSTPADQTSAPGSYPIAVSQGTLFGNDYTFSFVSSTLTVTSSSQTITFPAPPNHTFGDPTPVTLAATASSGLPVQYTATGPARLIGNVLDEFTSVGTVTITATQPGNGDYQAAAPVVVTLTIVPENLDVYANNVTRPFGADNPAFTYILGSTTSVIPANTYSGIPTITTSADANSAPGTYPIVITQGTLASNDYNFIFHNGTLTILQPASFILTTNPSSITVPRGQARQVTITLTPVNDFVGSVNIGCDSLPAGVTCVSSPATLTTTLDTQSGAVSPVQATLTISAGATVASAINNTPESRITFAGFASIPASLGVLFFGMRWIRFRRSAGAAWKLLLLVIMLLGAASLVACGGGSSNASGAQPGTTVVQVTGSGTSTSGPVDGSASLTVTIQ